MVPTRMPADTPAVLKIVDLEFYYDRPLIDLERFEIARRECVGLIGPSGCGKTTLIHLIAGLLRPVKGAVLISGHDLSKLNEAEIDRLRGKHIGIVFQQLHLLPSISVIDNLLLAQRLSRTTIDRDYAFNLLSLLGIDTLANKKPNQLSQGQAQRVAIARSVAHRPSLVVADEPTSALDDGNAADAMNLLRTITRQSEAALIVVTHDERARGQVDRVFDLGAVS